MIRSVASANVVGADRPVAQLVQLDRVTDQEPQRLAGQQLREVDLPAVHQLLGAPLPDRDHRTPGPQGDPGGAGLAGHRPQVGVAGDRALRVDHHRLALVHGLDRGQQRVGRLGGLALHRDLTARAQDPADHRDAEQGRLGQEPRPAPGEGQELSERERVGVGDVVDHEDHAAGLRDLVLGPPVPPGQRPDQRVEHRDDREDRAPSRLPVDLGQGPRRRPRDRPVGHPHLRVLVPADTLRGDHDSIDA